MDQQLFSFFQCRTRSCPGAIGKNDGTFGNHGLPLLIFCQFPFRMMSRDPLSDCFGNLFMIHEGYSHDSGTDDFCHVTLCRAEAPCRYHDVSPLQGRTEYAFHAFWIIPYCRMIYDRIPESIQFPRKIPGIFIDDFTQKQF